MLIKVIDFPYSPTFFSFGNLTYKSKSVQLPARITHFFCKPSRYIHIDKANTCFILFSISLSQKCWFIQVAGKHNPIYEAYYKQVDPKGVGTIEALAAATFLKKSGLSDVVLSRVSKMSIE